MSDTKGGEEMNGIGLDHLVVLTGDLDLAIRDYGRLGFTVTPGGEHADGLTRNALVPFADGTYIELVAFTDADDTQDNFWGWRSMGFSGLIDWCAASSDLNDRQVPGQTEPHPGGRYLTDGTELRWLTVRFEQRGRALPFLIEDLTPRAQRVPHGVSAKHPNGARGIAAVTVAVDRPEESAALFDALTGKVHRSASDTVEYGFRGTTVKLLGPKVGEDVRDHLFSRGPGPFGVELSGARGDDAQDGQLTHGLRMEFS